MMNLILWTMVSEKFKNWSVNGLINFPNKNKIIKLIFDLIDHGFNKTIRAGTSLTTLILSRSRRHGLNENQRFVAFNSRYDKIYLVTEKGEAGQFNNIQLDQGIIDLVKELEKENIN